MTKFRADNTEGYSAADLEILNARFLAECAEADVDPVDGEKSHIDNIAERVLEAFDTGRNP